MHTFLDLAGFAIVIIVLLGSAATRARSDDAFLVAERRLTLLPLVATLTMTEFNTSTLLAFSAAGYSAGPMALSLPLVFLVGLLFYTVTVARAWKRFDRLSVAELFAVRYSPGLGRVAAMLLLAAMLGFGATYVKSIALIFGPLVPSVSPALLSAVCTLVVLAVTLPGGLVTVVRSDVAAFVLTLLLVPLLLGLAVWHGSAAGGLATAFDASQLTLAPAAQWQHPALPFRFVTTLMVLTCMTYIAAPWYGQKIFAARDERTAAWAVALAAVLVFVLYGGLSLAAAYLRVVHPDLADAQLAVPTMLATWLPPGVQGAAYAVVFAAALTTLAGVWTAMAAMVAADFGWHDARHVRTQRLVIAVIALLHWAGSVWLVDDILDRLILANVPVAALSFALLAGFHWRRATVRGAWASIVVGVLWGAGCFIVIGEAGGYTWPWAMYGVPLIFVTGIAVSLLDPSGPPSVPQTAKA